MTDTQKLLFCTLIFIGGCGSGSSTPPPSDLTPTQNALPSDEIILGKVYAPNVSVPPDFLVDTASQLTGAYTLGHLRSTDLDPLATVPFELCTDDLTQALDWSNAVTLTRPRSGAMLMADESSRYFEITREIDGLEDWVALERVFKCAYLDRASVNLTEAFGQGGKLNVAPVTSTHVRELAEYLWHFSLFNNPGHAVLESHGAAHGEVERHTLTVAARQPLAGATAGCDLVEVFEWHFDVRPNGDITTSKEPVLQLDARWDGVQAQRCTS